MRQSFYAQVEFRHQDWPNVRLIRERLIEKTRRWLAQEGARDAGVFGYELWSLGDGVWALRLCGEAEQ